MEKPESIGHQRTQTCDKFPQIPTRVSTQNERYVIKSLISTPNNQGNTPSAGRFQFGSPEASNTYHLYSHRSAPALPQLDRDKLRQLLIKERDEAKDRLLKTQGFQRDISHMKDKQPLKISHTHPEFVEVFISSPKPTQYLPVNLEHLKAYVRNSDELGLPFLLTPAGAPHSLTCRKEKCIHEVETRTLEQQLSFKKAYEEFESLKSKGALKCLNKPFSRRVLNESLNGKDMPEEFAFLGAPSGRQEIQNLKEWYEFMKKAHLEPQIAKLSTECIEENPESILEVCNTVYQAGFRDMVRQVSVHCVDRGELLREILNSYHDMWKYYMNRISQRYLELLNSKDRNAKEIYESIESELELRNSEIIMVRFRQLQQRIQYLQKELQTYQDLNKELHEAVYSMKKTNSQLDADLQMKEKDVTRLFNKRIIYIDLLKKDTRYLISRKDGKRGRNPRYMKDRSLNSLLKSDSEEASETGHENQIDEIDPECKEENMLNSKDLKFHASSEVQTEMIECFNRESMTEIHMEDRVSSYIQTDEKIRRSFLRDVAAGKDIRVYMGYMRYGNVNIFPDIQIENSNTEVIPQEETTTKRVKQSRKRKSDSSKKKSGKRALKLPKISAHQVSQDTETEPQDRPHSGPLIDPSLDSMQNLGYLDTEASLNSACFNKKSDTTFVEIATQVNSEGMRGYDPDNEDAQILDMISSPYSKPTSPRSNHLGEISTSKENLYQIAEEDNERIDQDSQGIEAKIISEGYDIGKMELIPAGAHVPSWFSGFYTGFEQGKSEAEKLMLEIDKESPKNGMYSDSYETEDNEGKMTRSGTIQQSCMGSFISRRSRINSVILPQSDISPNYIRKGSKLTKSIGFLFTRLINPKKPDPSWKIIESIMSIPLDKLQQTPNMMPKKLLYKLISYLQQSLLIKYRAGEKLKSLSSISYKEFIQKYGLKQVAENKYKSFVISLLLVKNSRRIHVFCRLFGIGHKVNLANFSVHTFRFYLDCFACIIHSKLGVVTNVDETADIQMIPTARAFECVQEKGSQFLHEEELRRIESSLQISSVPDPKKANPTGIIEQELVLEMLANEFEIYQKDVGTVISGINDCLALCPNAEYISKNSLILIVRYIMPDSIDKFIDIAQDSNETLKAEVTKYARYENPEEEKAENLDSKPEDLLLLSKIMSYIIKNTAMKKGDYEKFLKLRDASKVNSEIDRSKIECLDLIAQIQLIRRDFDRENWRSKLNNLQESMSEFENIYILGTLKIWREEILKYHIVNT